MNKSILSSYKVFGGFGLLIILNGLIGFVTYHLIVKMRFDFFSITTWTENENIIGPIIIFIFQLVLIRLLLNENRFLIIKENRLTLYNPILPIIHKTIILSELDYCMNISENSRYAEHEALYFVKNGKVIDRISSFYYSNYPELKKGLGIKVKGNQRIGILKQMGIVMFGLTVKK